MSILILDFLNLVNVKKLKKEIENICGSYTHPHDILAEILQNAVDAINKFIKIYKDSTKKHSIEIDINCLKRRIIVRDTGVGLELSNLASSLSPHGTDKDKDEDSIGDKGVGLTFAVFSSSMVEVSSCNAYGKYTAKIESANAWKKGVIPVENIPIAEVMRQDSAEYPPNEYFTEISLINLEKIYEDNIDIFHISIDRLIYILQTRTAIGYLNYLWDKNHPNISIKLIHTDLNNETNEVEIDFKYLLPSKFLKPNEVIQLNDFESRAAGLSDRQRGIELKGKSLEIVGTKQKGNRKLRYYALFVPSRNVWRDISNKNNLVIESYSENEFNTEIKGGIYICTKGMPTAVELVPPVSGQMSYWANLYLLIEDDGISFDLGRKFIPGPTQAMYKDLAREIFNLCAKYNKYLNKDPQTRQIAPLQQAQKQRKFLELEKLNDLGLETIINYLKYPDKQEASVVAIFHELVGAKQLQGYYSLMHGYKLNYDLWAKYIIETKKIGSDLRDNLGDLINLNIIVEFKHDAHEILDDVTDDKKFFNEIDLIVCWDIDVRKFNKRGIQVRPLSPNEMFFYGSNYELIWPGSYDLGSAARKPVLCLRKFIEDLACNKKTKYATF